MAVVPLDVRGFRCPIPILKISMKVMKKEVLPGDLLEVTADCPTFESDLKQWCSQAKKTLVFLREEPAGTFKCQVKI
jgi:tRNA 2-thiouridine synthesizing protein A